MSTILRALQKIENETNADDNEGKPGKVHPISASHTFNRRLTTLWYRQLGKRFLLIGSGCLLVTAGAFFSLNYLKSAIPPDGSGQAAKQQPALPHPAGSPGRTIASNDAAPQQGPTRPRSYSPKPTHDPHYRPNRFSGEIAEESAPRETTIRPERRIEPPIENETLAPDGADAQAYADEADNPPAEAEAEQEPIEILESDPEEVRYAQVEPMDNGNLELQAISWSKEPNERIAVINNQIMHQGQNVKGYKVVYIGPEIVVVEQGGRQWKMVFMSR